MSSRFAGLLSLCVCTLVPVHSQTFNLGWSALINYGRSEIGKVTVVDQNGDVWVAGTTATAIDNFLPGPVEPIQWSVKGKNDIFLAKYHPLAGGGTQVLYWTWLGGTGDDDVRGLKIDAQGRVILVGVTDSIDFPTAGSAGQTTNAGTTDAWYAVIDTRLPGPSALVLSSYYGGTASDSAADVAVRSDGLFAIVGTTGSTDLPNISSGAIWNTSHGGWDAFILLVDTANPTPLVYASYFGGNSTDVATSAAFDREGKLWFAGYTASDQFPMGGTALQGTFAGSYDAFLVQVDFAYSGIEAWRYATYYGQSGTEMALKIDFDATGLLWMAMRTSSQNLWVSPDAYQSTPGGNEDIYLVSFDVTKPADQFVRYASYFGGDGYDILYGMTVLPNGRVALTGYTMFGTIPTAGTPYQPVPASLFPDSFLTVLNTGVAGAGALEYSTYMGGDYTDVGMCATSDSTGGVVVTGYTTSTSFPTTDGSTRGNPAAQPSMFVYRFSRNVS